MPLFASVGSTTLSDPLRPVHVTPTANDGAAGDGHGATDGGCPGRRAAQDEQHVDGRPGGHKEEAPRGDEGWADQAQGVAGEGPRRAAQHRGREGVLRGDEGRGQDGGALLPQQLAVQGDGHAPRPPLQEAPRDQIRADRRREVAVSHRTSQDLDASHARLDLQGEGARLRRRVRRLRGHRRLPDGAPPMLPRCEEHAHLRGRRRGIGREPAGAEEVHGGDREEEPAQGRRDPGARVGG